MSCTRLGSSSTPAACNLERLLVVVREQLGLVVRAPEAFDPFTGATMLLRACAPWNLAVSDVTQQHVLKGVLRVPGDRGSSLPPNEVLPLERA